MTTIGSAFIEVRADLSKIKSDVAGVSKAGDDSGAKFSEAFESNLQGITTKLTESISKADAAYLDAGHAAGAKFDQGAKAGVEAGAAGIASSARGEAEVAGKESGTAFRDYGEKAGEKFSEGAKEGIKGVGSILAGGAALGAGELVKSSLEAADSLEQANIKIENVFGASGEEVQKWAAGMAQNFGLSQTAAETMTGTFAQMLKPMGLSSDEAASMSEKLSQLTQDVAQFNGADPVSVQNAITSALRGRGTALRQYGVDLSAATLNEAVRTQGLGKSFTALSTAKQGELAYQLILQQTSKMQGAYAKSSDSSAVEMQKLHAEMSNVSAGLGKQLMPLLVEGGGILMHDVIPALQTSGHWISENSAWLKPLVIALGAAYVAYKLTSLGTDLWQKSTAALTAVMGLFTPAAEDAAAAEGEVDAAMDANPIGLVVAALTLLVAGFILAWQKSETFRAIVEGAWNGIKTAALAVANFFTVDIPKAFEAIVTALKDVWKKVLAFMETWGPLALAVLFPFIGIPLLIAQHFRQIVGWLRDVWRTVSGDVRAYWNDVIGFIEGIPARIFGVIAQMGRWASSVASAMWQGLKAGIADIADLGKDLYNAVADSINHYLIDPIKNWHFTIGAFGVHHTFQPFGGIPDIPMLATGGMTMGPMLAGIGDNPSGNEAVLPMDSPATIGMFSDAFEQAGVGSSRTRLGAAYDAETSAMLAHVAALTDAVAQLAANPTVLNVDSREIARASNQGQLALGRL